MASILDILNTKIGEDLVWKAAEETSTSSATVSFVLSMSLPLILGNFKNKIQEGSGTSLYELLDQAPNPYKFLNVFKEKNGDELVACGNDYGEMILWENFNAIVSTISMSLDAEEDAIKRIVLISIPVLVAILSIQKEKEKLSYDSIEDLIDNALGSISKYKNSFIETILYTKEDAGFIQDPKAAGLGYSSDNKDSILKGYTGGK